MGRLSFKFLAILFSVVCCVSSIKSDNLIEQANDSFAFDVAAALGKHVLSFVDDFFIKSNNQSIIE